MARWEVKKKQNSGERCKIPVGHSGERCKNLCWSFRRGKYKSVIQAREEDKYNERSIRREFGQRRKSRSRGQARGGKDKGFGEQKGKIQSCQAMQIQLQAPIQAIQHQASPGETVNYRRLLQLRPRLRLSLRPESSGAKRLQHHNFTHCLQLHYSVWL